MQTAHLPTPDQIASGQLTKDELLSAITYTSAHVTSLTINEGVIAALLMFADWFAAHPRVVSTWDIENAWIAGQA